MMAFCVSDVRVSRHGTRIYYGVFLKGLVQFLIISGNSTFGSHSHIHLPVCFLFKEKTGLRQISKKKYSRLLKKCSHMVLAMNTQDCKQNSIENWQDIPWCHWLRVLHWLGLRDIKCKNNISSGNVSC